MNLLVTTTRIPDVLLLAPQVHHDARGSFLEHYNVHTFQQATGFNVSFVQDNLSTSQHRVLRGLHYQAHYPQGKLVSVLQGRIYDVAVDLRKDSSTFGQHVATELTATSFQQLWIPPGFAHGYLVLSQSATVHYKVTQTWHPGDERILLWNDPALGIDWLIEENGVILSDKDRHGLRLIDAPAIDVL